MSAKSTFDAAIERSEHYLHLYNLLHNTGTRKAKSSWLKKVKVALNWQQNDEVMRIHTMHGTILTRNSETFGKEHFQHEFLSELLRSAIVSAVSALDRYTHDLILDKSWIILGRAENKIPKGWDKISIPIYEAKKAVTRVKKQSNAKPGNKLKLALQEVLYRESFQGSNSISKSAKILGIADFWKRTSSLMNYEYSSQDTQDMIDEVTHRRHQIVHEADLIRKIRKGSDKLHPITRRNAEWYVTYIRDFANAFDKLASEI